MSKIESICKKEEKLQEQFRAALNKHLIKLFDDEGERVGIVFTEPCTGDEGIDDGNAEYLYWMTDALTSIGASINDTSGRYYITWPRFLDIGDTLYELEVNHTGLFVPVEAGPIGVYMAKLYDLALDAIYSMQGDAKGRVVDYYNQRIAMK